MLLLPVVSTAATATMLGPIRVGRSGSSDLFRLLLLSFSIPHLMVHSSSVHLSASIGSSIGEDGLAGQVLFLVFCLRCLLRRLMLTIGQVVQDLFLHELLAEDAGQLLDVALEDLELVSTARGLLAATRS